MQRLFTHIIIVSSLFLMHSVSFGMIIRHTNDEKLKEQDWCALKQIYDNKDNSKLKNFLEKNDVPIIIINQSPLITTKQAKAILVDPYELLSSKDFLQLKEKHTKSYSKAYNNFIQKIKQEKFALLGSDAHKTLMNVWDMTVYHHKCPLMKAVLFGTRGDVVDALDKYINDNVNRKVIKRSLNVAITVAIDCSYVKKDILELLLREKKKFHVYNKYLHHAGKKAFNLLAIAAKINKHLALLLR